MFATIVSFSISVGLGERKLYKTDQPGISLLPATVSVTHVVIWALAPKLAYLASLEGIGCENKLILVYRGIYMFMLFTSVVLFIWFITVEVQCNKRLWIAVVFCVWLVVTRAVVGIDSTFDVHNVVRIDFV